MALVNMKEMLGAARKAKKAVGAFNITNYETAIAAIRAAESEKQPVIVQLYMRLFDTGKARDLAPLLRSLAERASVPVALHLDHGSSEKQAADALSWGYTSVMYDGSRDGFEANAAATGRVVAAAHAAGPAHDEDPEEDDEQDGTHVPQQRLEEVVGLFIDHLAPEGAVGGLCVEKLLEVLHRAKFCGDMCLAVGLCLAGAAAEHLVERILAGIHRQLEVFLVDDDFLRIAVGDVGLEVGITRLIRRLLVAVSENHEHEYGEYDDVEPCEVELRLFALVALIVGLLLLVLVHLFPVKED